MEVVNVGAKARSLIALLLRFLALKCQVSYGRLCSISSPAALSGFRPSVAGQSSG